MIKKILIFAWILALPIAGYASLELATDHRSLSFGAMQLGEEKELADFGGYQNEVTCRSTNGISWYLKINLLQPLSSGGDAIPAENLKWQLSWTNGNGTKPGGYTFKGFSLMPDLVYISGPGESSGGSIRFQFKYSLKIPEIQHSGVYNATIRFTLTEMF
jgi:hypothetical protein